MRARLAKRAIALFLVGTLVAVLAGGSCASKSAAKSTDVAVEFNNHAACAYVAHAKGWFEEEGLDLLQVFQVYESGAAIAAALARGDIQIGYLGLTGAIMAYARGVPIKVVAGVHKYGYGLVARPGIEKIEDLQGKRIGCLREGTVTDLLLYLMREKYQLEDLTVMRMSPSEEVIALVSGTLDAAFLPEQHATVAESAGFPMLLQSQELWPGMQGDVLVVNTGLMKSSPGLVRRLVEITENATAWINEHPDETAQIMAEELQAAGEKLGVGEDGGGVPGSEITPELISRSMDRIVYSTDIDPGVVQETIDYMVGLGYLEEGMRAEDILDLTYLGAR